MIQSTEQQKAVVGQPVGKGEVMLLNAYAGTGKTTTLEMIAQANPQLRYLYLCFNRDNAREAQRRFPRWCECSTIHSKAWHAVGRNFSKVGNPRPREVMEAFRMATPFLAVYVIETLNAFLHSTDPEIDWKHVCSGPSAPERQRGQIRTVARKLWDRMQDETDATIPMSHDGYLKLWALQKPVIEGFDIIFLDEAQDTNPVTLEIVLQQVETKTAGLVLVGDTHQSIYGWRQAVDAMEQVASIANFRFPLTESFRFGAGIAHDATLLLNHLKGDDVELIGRGDSTGKLNSFAVLARTNARLISAAVEKARDGMGIHFSATVPADNWDPFGPYKFQMTLDIYHLWSNQLHRIRDPYMKKFKSFQEVEEHAKGEGGEGSGRDVELALQAELVKEHGHAIPELLELLRAQSCAPDQAKLAFSTTHRAKGKEWDAVHLLDDFLDPGDEELITKANPVDIAEESNILYVAVTRAKKKILYSPELFTWFEQQTEPGINVVHRMTPKPAKPPTAASADGGILDEGDLQAIARKIATKRIQKPTSGMDPKLQSVREVYYRAYEPWYDSEDQLLEKAFRLTEDVEKLAPVFGRQPGSLRTRLQRLKLVEK